MWKARFTWATNWWKPNSAVFPEVKENQQLKTEEGRAEVLLTPGVFLRLGENSSFRMITNRLIDTRLEFLSGAAIVEAEDIGKDNSVTVVYGDATVHPLKKGIYRFDAGLGRAARLRWPGRGDSRRPNRGSEGRPPDRARIRWPYASSTRPSPMR